MLEGPFTQQLSGLLKESSEFTLVPTAKTNHTHLCTQEDAPKSNLVFSLLFKDTLICELQGPWMKQRTVALAATTAHLSHIWPDDHARSDDSWICPFLNQASHCWIMSVSDDIWLLSPKDDLLLRQLRSCICVLEPAHTNNHVTGDFSMLLTPSLFKSGRITESSSADSCGPTHSSCSETLYLINIRLFFSKNKLIPELVFWYEIKFSLWY